MPGGGGTPAASLIAAAAAALIALEAEELAEDMPRCWRLEAGRLSETPAFLPAAAAAGLCRPPRVNPPAKIKPLKRPFPPLLSLSALQPLRRVPGLCC